MNKKPGKKKLKKAIIDDIDNRSREQIENLNLMPPFHGRCRCEIVPIGTTGSIRVPIVPTR
jgi:hypothetical protein